MNPNLVKKYKIINDIRGDPQEYKGIKLYPIKIGDIELKEKFYRLMFHPKMYIQQREILRMSYLKFLIFVVQENIKNVYEDVDLLNDLIEFLSKITGKDNVAFKIFEHPEEIDPFDKISIHIDIDGIEISEFDFDDIRAIVLEQNGFNLEYIESYDPSLEDKLAFMRRGQEETDLKDEIYSFCAITNLSEIEACDKTLFQFKSRLEREMVMKDYQSFKPLEVSGQISSKDKSEELFKHYLSHIPRQTRYGSILVDKDKFLDESGMSDPNSGVKFE